MRVISVPPHDRQDSDEKWDVNHIQFTPEGHALVVEWGGSLSWFVAHVNVATEQSTQAELHIHPDSGDCGEQPCRRDFGCVVYWFEAENSHVQVFIGDPKQDPFLIRRTIETHGGIDAVRGLRYSPNDRWLFGIEEWQGESSRTAISRVDLQAIFAKKVTEKPAMNRLTGAPYIQRYVTRTWWKRVADLPAGVCAEVLAISSDGRIVAAGTVDGDTHLIRVRDGTSLGVLPRKSRKRVSDIAVRRLEFSLSAKQLGVLSEGQLNVWDTKALQWLWGTKSNASRVTDIAYHPSGSTIAVSHRDGAVSCFDPQSGKLQQRYDWKVGQLNSVAFSPDGLTCAAGGEKGQIVVWDVDS